MITKTDRSIYNFLEMFNSATTKQIYRMFYAGKTLRLCRNRLKTLVDKKYINRSKDFVTGEYIYYVKPQKPEQIEHGYFRTELFLKLRENYCISNYDVECKDIQGLRPDMYLEVKTKNELHMFFVEIHLHNRFNQNKYEEYFRSMVWKERAKVFPKIVIVAHEPPKLNKTDLNYRILPTSLVNINSILT